MIYVPPNSDTQSSPATLNKMACLGKISSTGYEYHFILEAGPEESTQATGALKKEIADKLSKFHSTYAEQLRGNNALSAIGSHALNARLNKILKGIYSLQPKTLALQPTSDSSILISFVKEDKKTYVEFFPENTTLGIDEFVLNMYRGNEDLVDSFSGSSTQVLGRIKAELANTMPGDDAFLYHLNPVINGGNIPGYFVASTQL